MSKVFLHISCKFGCVLYANGAYAGTLPPPRTLPCAGDFVHIEAEEGETVALTAAPTRPEKGFGIKYLPVSCVISIGKQNDKNKLKSEGANARLIEFPANHYEIILKEDITYGYCPPAPTAQDNAVFKGERHVVTVFRDTLDQAVIEGGGRLYSHVLPTGYAHEKTEFEVCPEYLLIKFNGNVKKENCKDKRYFAAIAFDGEYRLLLNAVADAIEFEGNELQTLTHRDDIARRAEVITYALKDGSYEITNKYMAYLLDAPGKPRHPRLIPYALFEAVKAGDFAEARSFLTDSLNSDISDDGALEDFFKEYDVMRENIYYPDIKNAVLLTGGGKGDILEFSYREGKIDNMKIL